MREMRDASSINLELLESLSDDFNRGGWLYPFTGSIWTGLFRQTSLTPLFLTLRIWS